MTVDKKEINDLLDYWFTNWFSYSKVFNSLQNNPFGSRAKLNWRDFVSEIVEAIGYFNDIDLPYNKNEAKNYKGKPIIATSEFIASAVEKFATRVITEIRDCKYVTIPFRTPSHREILTYVKNTYDFPETIDKSEIIRSFGRQVGTWKGNPDGRQNMEKSNIPMYLRAHKSTPKHKTGIRQLENSVRKMF